MPFCPSCQHALEDVPSLAGQRVSCPSCSTRFTWPTATIPSAVPSGTPVSSPSQPAFSRPSQPASEFSQPTSAFGQPGASTASPIQTAPRTRRRHRSDRFRPATSWLDLFDWKFEKYITPWIVRATWIQFLGLAAMWFVVATLAFAASFVEDVPPRRPSYDRESRIETRVETPQAVQDVAEFIEGGLLKFSAFASAIMVLLIFTLWVRLVLESVIVVFDMAESLREIRTNTGRE